MNVIKLTEESYFGALLEAEKILKSGGLVAGPTDTVYGIFGRADDENTVKRIYSLKKRPEKKPLAIFVRDVTMARKYAYISDTKAEFLERVWPGQVTVVFHHKEKLTVNLTGGEETIAMRIPENRFLRDILQKLGVPLAQTSANLYGKAPAKDIQKIREYFADAKEPPELIIDGGELFGKPSAVLGFTGAEPMVLRTGMLKKEDFDHLLDSML